MLAIVLFASILGSAPQRSDVCHWRTLLLPPSDSHGHARWQPTHVVSLHLDSKSKSAVPIDRWSRLEHAVARAAAINPSAVAVMGGGSGSNGQHAGPSKAVLRMRVAAPCAQVAARLLRKCTGAAGAGAALQRAVSSAVPGLRLVQRQHTVVLL